MFNDLLFLKHAKPTFLEINPTDCTWCVCNKQVVHHIAACYHDHSFEEHDELCMSENRMNSSLTVTLSAELLLQSNGCLVIHSRATLHENYSRILPTHMTLKFCYFTHKRARVQVGWHNVL